MNFLYGLQLFGMKAGLRNIRALSAYLGHPHEGFPSVHVAGTNGKGSTSAMIASVLTASGYRTGLYTSPHLRRFSERIRIDGVPIPEAELVRYIEAMRSAIDRTGATFFEATTAMAFAYFADSDVDAAVIETGLGGRLDATNIVDPVLSVITGIGFDHTEHLGNTLAKIAYEKAGIIKRGVSVVSGVTDSGARRIIAARAAALSAPLAEVRHPALDALEGESLDGLTLSVADPLVPKGALFVSMAGGHQARNASAALRALGLLKNAGFDRVTTGSVAAGFAHIRRNTGLRGRIDTLRTSPLIVADVGHNADGVRTLVRALRRVFAGRLVVLFGVMKDKDHVAMLDALAGVSRTLVAVKPRTERARDTSSILEACHAQSMRAIDGRTVGHGLSVARMELRPGEMLLVTGSHYVVGEAMDALRIA